MSSVKRAIDPEEKNRVEGGTLYLVATPIGNLADLSERAIKVLREVDFIAAEDTRNSMRLLTHLGISKPLVSYFEHNKRERGAVIADRLAAGESCALITDAGTPAISDPGEDLVVLCAERGIPVTHIPGACAAIVALTLSALPTGRFVFDGFLPVAKAERRERLAEIARERRTVILHEAPHKLRATLDDLLGALGDRSIALCRELTKRNEEIMRMTLSSAVAYYREHDPRGEYVLVLSGSQTPPAADADAFWQTLTPADHVAHYEALGMGRMDAMKKAAKDRGVSKSEIYALLLQTKGEE
ncbi:MAG: 16S rRNA (cytidine(1402)-2'-O)-methyltransferase [Clostridia bacterium]|nr:16S rRNA (cytidine(1402)-2'-O)-methyltransferase [Clostridia bacterium]